MTAEPRSASKLGVQDLQWTWCLGSSDPEEQEKATGVGVGGGIGPSSVMWTQLHPTPPLLSFLPHSHKFSLKLLEERTWQGSQETGSPEEAPTSGFDPKFLQLKKSLVFVVCLNSKLTLRKPRTFLELHSDRWDQDEPGVTEVSPAY